MSSAETPYSTTEREGLAVVDVIKKYEPYLSGKKFFVHTDLSSLSWLMLVKDHTGRLARWALRLQQYDFEIIHRSCVANGNADALSRHVYSASPSAHEVSSLDLSVAVVDHPCPPPSTLHKLQRQDQDLADIIKYFDSFIWMNMGSFVIYGHLESIVLSLYVQSLCHSCISWA